MWSTVMSIVRHWPSQQEPNTAVVSPTPATMRCPMVETATVPEAPLSTHSRGFNTEFSISRNASLTQGKTFAGLSCRSLLRKMLTTLFASCSETA
mmetsp:Transcript_7626/g.11831  ORF Transcript_7626/g.11831 Transcript_7626/m.11831 type:complete len:95 (-) Transcript_7626:387-671(-)